MSQVISNLLFFWIFHRLLDKKVLEIYEELSYAVKN